MRPAVLVAVAVAACGSPSPPVVQAPTPAPAPSLAAKHALAPHAAVDPIAAMTSGTEEVSWIVPGPVQLVLGGPSLDAQVAAEPIEVVLLDDRGGDVRVGVPLELVKFAVWTSRARLLGVLAANHRIAERPGGDAVFGPDPVEVIVRASTPVRRLARRDGWTQIRYVGALEVEGWVPDDAIVDHIAAKKPVLGRFPTGRQTLMVMPGAVVRAEPRWGTRELATVANGYLLDTIRDVDDAWVEVGYEDGDLFLHGYVSKQDPPGRTHRPHEPEVAGMVILPSDTVAAGTCLYASEGGEAIGFVTAAAPSVIQPGTRPSWYQVTLDTPWGPVAFGATGASETELAACPHD